jgi:colicin import membrane protein
MREQQTMADTRTDAQKAAEAKADADKAAADKAAADKLAADRVAAEKAVREAKTPAEKAAAEKALEQVAEREDAQKQRKAAHAGPLAPAGASGDPDVHRLLAERQAHVSNAGIDPVVRAHPDWFSTDPRYGLLYSVEPDGYDAPVEEATAVPGERRNTRRGGA